MNEREVSHVTSLRLRTTSQHQHVIVPGSLQTHAHGQFLCRMSLDSDIFLLAASSIILKIIFMGLI